MSAIANEISQPTAHDVRPHASRETAAALRAASERVAPVWPLRNFVAVNPFLGHTEKDFINAASHLGAVSGAQMTLPGDYYLNAYTEGRITDSDIEAGLREVSRFPNAPTSVEEVMQAAERGWVSPEALPTISDLCAAIDDTDWSTWAERRVAAFAAAYFDEGQASWQFHAREMSPYEAWRLWASIDRAPDVAGIREFREDVKRLPQDAAEAAETLLRATGLPRACHMLFLERQLATIGGWAARARHFAWQDQLDGQENDVVEQLAVVRLAHDVFMLNHFIGHKGFSEALASMQQDYRDLAQEQATPTQDQLAAMALQTAFDRAAQVNTVRQFAATNVVPVQSRPALQASFCIDVRSERYRRAMETAAAGMGLSLETIGFAGFYGFPIEYVPLGQTHGGHQCPVLLKPKYVVQEAVAGADVEEQAEILGLRILRRRAARSWKSFKLAAVSSFSFVETMGLTYAIKLVTDSLGMTRPSVHPSADGLDQDVQRRLQPQLRAATLDGRDTGFTPEACADMAEQVLRSMSLTRNFARIVLLTGHGSSTTNNPHATGLDCGACGGHTGEANARVAAAVLNYPEVRIALRERGINIPDDTVFLGALHDTTTDIVRVFDIADVPQSHADDLKQLEQCLDLAATSTREERAPSLGLQPGESADSAIVARSRDWSEVRPEWGLAGCSAFIAAPRSRTKGLNFDGRAFLHSYDWRADSEFTVLESILTAPVVVASWISLQYFGSTVDNEVFGCGNKTLHNVVGLFGVQEGNGGDLRVGLPLQSVHDGTRYVHEPIRLSVVVEAPIQAMTDVIARNPGLRDLLDNRWIFLFAMNSSGRIHHRYVSGLQWEKIKDDANTERAVA